MSSCAARCYSEELVASCCRPDPDLRVGGGVPHQRRRPSRCAAADYSARRAGAGEPRHHLGCGVGAGTGAAFDRLFLEGMIRHHAGAITMVEELFATPGAGQDPTIFSYASDVDADQRMEIDRMGAMLKELQK